MLLQSISVVLYILPIIVFLFLFIFVYFLVFFFFFFFFQAEDGIRDADVTGVQTCALPISCRRKFFLLARSIEALEIRRKALVREDLPATGDLAQHETAALLLIFPRKLCESGFDDGGLHVLGK